MFNCVTMCYTELHRVTIQQRPVTLFFTVFNRVAMFYNVLQYSSTRSHYAFSTLLYRVSLCYIILLCVTWCYKQCVMLCYTNTLFCNKLLYLKLVGKSSLITPHDTFYNTPYNLLGVMTPCSTQFSYISIALF